jgi:hypothetical protein
MNETFILFVFLAVLEFSALGLFYHLFTRRLDLLSERYERQAEALAADIRNISPLHAYQQVASMRGDIADVWKNLAVLAGKSETAESDRRLLREEIQTQALLAKNAFARIESTNSDVSRQLADLVAASHRGDSEAQIV